MHSLTVNVIYATGLKREIARAAIAHVLLFLRDRLPETHFAEFTEKMREAQSVNEAAATAENGAREAIEGIVHCPEKCGADILVAKLSELGLNDRAVQRSLQSTI